MPLSKCSGCTHDLKEDDAMHCSRCFDKYHYGCLNISTTKFDTFSSEFKAMWICPSCRCKEPKRDNTNTPIRSTSTLSSAQCWNSSDTDFSNTGPLATNLEKYGTSQERCQEWLAPERSVCREFQCYCRGYRSVARNIDRTLCMPLAISRTSLR
ncbi:unnamed protein product [Danaus chrysippus]|uniref:(African queen) hypothetical protein n=1 Tax=Danaus chrysippus TaxID=151541 RepID=A0A8J2QP37_9NEOP|nr:unnamed protein product [Danaus chrysippus]